MMGVNRKHQRINPELCFEIWAETGSIAHVGEILKKRHNLYNIRTGEPFSVQGVWRAAGKYVYEHMAEARSVYEKVWRANGVLITDQDWYEFVLAKTRYMKDSKRKEWLARNSFILAYEKK